MSCGPVRPPLSTSSLSAPSSPHLIFWSYPLVSGSSSPKLGRPSPLSHPPPASSATALPAAPPPIASPSSRLLSSTSSGVIVCCFITHRGSSDAALFGVRSRRDAAPLNGCKLPVLRHNSPRRILALQCNARTTIASCWSPPPVMRCSTTGAVEAAMTSVSTVAAALQRYRCCKGGRTAACAACRDARHGISLNFGDRHRRCCIATPPVLPAEAAMTSASAAAASLHQNGCYKGGRAATCVARRDVRRGIFLNSGR
jgi:hypothetical protein